MKSEKYTIRTPGEITITATDDKKWIVQRHMPPHYFSPRYIASTLTEAQIVAAEMATAQEGTA